MFSIQSTEIQDFEHLSGEHLLQFDSFTSHNLVDLQQYKKREFKYQESINNNNKQFKVNIPEMQLAHQVPLTLPKNS